MSFEVLIDGDSATWLQVPESCPCKVFNRFLHRGELDDAQATSVLLDAIERRSRGLAVFVAVIAGHAVILHKAMVGNTQPEQERQARLLRLPGRMNDWFRSEFSPKPQPPEETRRVTNGPTKAKTEKQLTLF